MLSTKIMVRRSNIKLGGNRVPRRRNDDMRITFDGLNLALARGTGIATYTRALTRAAHDLGHEVGVVYSTPFTPAKNPVLREIAFFDEKRPRDVRASEG